MTEANDESAAMAAIEAKLEAEALAAEADSTRIPDGDPCRPAAYPSETFPTWLANQQPPGPLPLDDLRERIAILTAAGVTHYRDAGVELHIDLEARTRNPPNTKKVEF